MSPEPPCYYCQFYGAAMDWHTGIEDEWCNAPEEFQYYDGARPCPHFKPMLASDGLLEQLANEEEAIFYQSLEDREADE